MSGGSGTKVVKGERGKRAPLTFESVFLSSWNQGGGDDGCCDINCGTLTTACMEVQGVLPFTMDI